MQTNEFRTRCVLLGLICLTPSLLFWVVNNLPVDLKFRPINLLFGDSTGVEFFVCAVLFPIISIGLGWNAFHRCEDKTLSKFVIALGFIQLAGAAAAHYFGLT